jgi:hypothetical protein
VTSKKQVLSLPYLRTFFEKVPLKFVNLEELSRGALESRALAGDAYWRIDADNPIAYLALRKGRPYQIIGSDSPDLRSFLSWLRHDRRELTITYHFVAEGALPCLLRYWTEDPVLCGLENSQGDVLEMLLSMKKSEESGLLKLKFGSNLGLIPVSSGKLSKAFLPGRTLVGRELITFLKSEETSSAVADFFMGRTSDLSPLGISEVLLLLASVNIWLESLRPIWPACDAVLPNLFKEEQMVEICLESITYEQGDGFYIRSTLVESESLPSAFAGLINALCEKHPSSANALKLFFTKNKANRIALDAIGLTPLLKEK